MNDEFLILSAIIVAVITVIDFLSGPDGRKLIKEKFYNWWFIVEKSSFAGFTTTEAEKVSNRMYSFLGKRFFGMKYFLKSSLLNLIIAIIIFFILFVILIKQSGLPLESFFHIEIDDWQIFIHSITNILPFVLSILFVFGWMSLGISHLFIRLLAKCKSLLGVIAILTLNYFAAFCEGGLILGLHEFYIELRASRNLNFDDVLAYFFIVVLITVLLPFLFLTLIGILFVLSKMFLPLIKKPISLILERVADSEKGFLTIMVGAIVGLANLIKNIKSVDLLTLLLIIIVVTLLFFSLFGSPYVRQGLKWYFIYSALIIICFFTFLFSATFVLSYFTEPRINPEQSWTGILIFGLSLGIIFVFTLLQIFSLNNKVPIKSLFRNSNTKIN